MTLPLSKQSWISACLLAACVGVAPAYAQSAGEKVSANDITITLDGAAAPQPPAVLATVVTAPELLLASRQADPLGQQRTVTLPERGQLTSRQGSVTSQAQSKARLGIITRDGTRIYRKADSRSAELYRCDKGTAIGLIGQLKKYYAVLMVDRSLGFVEKSRVELYNRGVAIDTDSGKASSRIVQIALEYIGIPYVWGGTSRQGLDCSGFVKSVYARLGIQLPRVARDQFNVGRPVRWGELAPGDRLYFSNKGYVDHTGIYIGGGRFIHASGSHDAVVISSVTERKYFRTLVGARRS